MRSGRCPSPPPAPRDPQERNASLECSLSTMKRVYYGWWMVGAGSLMQFVQSTLLLQSFGAYFAVLRDDRGWSKTELSGAAAIHQVEAAVLGPVIGWFLDRFGPRWVIRIGVLVFGSGFMLLSQVDSLLA